MDAEAFERSKNCQISWGVVVVVIIAMFVVIYVIFWRNCLTIILYYFDPQLVDVLPITLAILLLLRHLIFITRNRIILE